MEDLESRLKKVLNSISNEISEKEKTSEEFFNIFRSELTSQGFLTGEYGRDCKIQEYFLPKVIKKLNICSDSGLNNQYFFSKNSSISKEANQDIYNYDQLVNEVGTHLRETIGEREIKESELKQEITDFVNSKKIMKEVLPIRRESFIETLQNYYTLDLNVVKDKKISGYKLEEIDKAFKNI